MRQTTGLGDLGNSSRRPTPPGYGVPESPRPPLRSLTTPPVLPIARSIIYRPKMRNNSRVPAEQHAGERWVSSGKPGERGVSTPCLRQKRQKENHGRWRERHSTAQGLVAYGCTFRPDQVHNCPLRGTPPASRRGWSKSICQRAAITDRVSRKQPRAKPRSRKEAHRNLPLRPGGFARGSQATSANAAKRQLRSGCRSLMRPRISIWRMRSRVTPIR